MFCLAGGEGGEGRGCLAFLAAGEGRGEVRGGVELGLFANELWCQAAAARLSTCTADCWPLLRTAAVRSNKPDRNLFDYDQVVNTQRDRVYAERRRALLSDDLSPLMVEYAERTCDDILEVRGGGGWVCVWVG